jgi:hypothetical protein
MVSRWSAWGACTKTCSKKDSTTTGWNAGTKRRTRSAVTASARGGAACPKLTEVVDCSNENRECPVDADLPTRASCCGAAGKAAYCACKGSNCEKEQQDTFNSCVDINDPSKSFFWTDGSEKNQCGFDLAQCSPATPEISNLGMLAILICSIISVGGMMFLMSCCGGGGRSYGDDGSSGYGHEDQPVSYGKTQAALGDK